MGWGWGFKPYVSVAERRQKAIHKMDKLRKKGINIQPVEIDGRKIARTFWGQSWCQHLESFSDYENLLPRGRTYVRNGSVCHLEITGGEVKAMVSGSELYNVKIGIKQLPEKIWRAVKERCSGKIGSLLELLQGRLSNSVMTVVTDRQAGLFPLPSEISLDCSCPDWATMCKHVAAVLYGVGARLDEKPELLFLLRGVDHEELIETDASAATHVIGSKRGVRHIAESDLENLFGIEMLTEKSSNNEQQITKPGADKTMSKKQESAHSGGSKQYSIDPSEKPIKKNTSNQPTTRKTEMSSRKKTISTKPTGTVVSVVKDLSPTGKTVQELRTQLGMSQIQLALLMGVGATSVGTWEKKGRQKLNLQPRTTRALNAVRKLTKKQAWARLGKVE